MVGGGVRPPSPDLSLLPPLQLSQSKALSLRQPRRSQGALRRKGIYPKATGPLTEGTGGSFPQGSWSRVPRWRPSVQIRLTAPSQTSAAGNTEDALAGAEPPVVALEAVWPPWRCAVRVTSSDGRMLTSLSLSSGHPASTPSFPRAGGAGPRAETGEVPARFREPQKRPPGTWGAGRDGCDGP